MVPMKEGPRGLVGVSEARAVRGGPSWSLVATAGVSDVNLRTRSLTEPACWNWDRPARGTGSALLMLEEPLAGAKVLEGSVGPGGGLLMTGP